jgi:hypothetical protein
MPAVILSYVSASDSLRPGDSRLAEIDAIDRSGQPDIAVVDVNSRLVTVDLPAVLVAAHGQIVGGAAPDLDRFRTYQDWYRQGLLDANRELDPVEAVVRMAGELSDPAADIDPAEVSRIGQEWLAAYGRAALNFGGAVELDLGPLLAGAMVVDTLVAGDAGREPLAVLLLHQLGRRAAASLHTEQMATSWIGAPDRHRLGGAWERLRALTIQQEMSPRDVRQLRQFCRAMLTKPALRAAERALAPIARSLIASIGELESAEETLADAPILAEAAVWARSLLPPTGFDTAQPSVLPEQREVLHRLAEHVLNDAVPLIVLPVVAPIPRSLRTMAEEVMAKLNDDDRS